MRQALVMLSVGRRFASSNAWMQHMSSVTFVGTGARNGAVLVPRVAISRVLPPPTTATTSPSSKKRAPPSPPAMAGVQAPASVIKPAVVMSSQVDLAPKPPPPPPPPSATSPSPLLPPAAPQFGEKSEMAKRVAVMVKFELGDCVFHPALRYRGVVYGYDATCKQGEAWIQRQGIDGLSRGRHQPFYHVLVDVRDKGPSFTYVAEECLQRERSTAGGDLRHPLLEKLFEGFDASRGKFVPREHLAASYPSSSASNSAAASLAGETVKPTDKTSS